MRGASRSRALGLQHAVYVSPRPTIETGAKDTCAAPAAHVPLGSSTPYAHDRALTTDVGVRCRDHPSSQEYPIKPLRRSENGWPPTREWLVAPRRVPLQHRPTVNAPYPCLWQPSSPCLSPLCCLCVGSIQRQCKRPPQLTIRIFNRHASPARQRKRMSRARVHIGPPPTKQCMSQDTVPALQNDSLAFTAPREYRRGSRACIAGSDLCDSAPWLTVRIFKRHASPARQRKRRSRIRVHIGPPPMKHVSRHCISFAE